MNWIQFLYYQFTVPIQDLSYIYFQKTTAKERIKERFEAGETISNSSSSVFVLVAFVLAKDEKLSMMNWIGLE